VLSRGERPPPRGHSWLGAEGGDRCDRPRDAGVNLRKRAGGGEGGGRGGRSICHNIDARMNHCEYDKVFHLWADVQPPPSESLTDTDADTKF